MNRDWDFDLKSFAIIFAVLAVVFAIWWTLCSFAYNHYIYMYIDKDWFILLFELTYCIITWIVIHKLII